MNKQELIDAIYSTMDVSKATIGAVLSTYVEVVKKTVADGGSVEWLGFGKISSGERAAREGRNPKTGEKIKIAETRTVKFTAGKAFKEAVNGKAKK